MTGVFCFLSCSPGDVKKREVHGLKALSYDCDRRADSNASVSSATEFGKAG